MKRCIETEGTKCIFVCGKSKTAEKPAPLFLDGKELPWVDSAVHLGNVLHDKLKAALSMRLPAVPDGESWRMLYLLKLLEARGQAHYKGDDVT